MEEIQICKRCKHALNAHVKGDFLACVACGCTYWDQTEFISEEEYNARFSPKRQETTLTEI